MMFTLKWTATAVHQYKELRAVAERSLKNRKSKKRAKSTQQEGLFKQVHKTIQLLRENPRHPGLNTHPYHSLPCPYKKGGKVFEAYAQNATPGAYRVFWCYGPGGEDLTIIAITPHP